MPPPSPWWRKRRQTLHRFWKKHKQSTGRAWKKARQTAQRRWKQWHQQKNRWQKQTQRQATRRWKTWRKPLVKGWKNLNQRAQGWPNVAWQAVLHFSRNQGFVMAAVMSYYALLSLFPLSLVLITLSSSILQPGEAITQFKAFLDQTAPGATDFVNVNLGPIRNRRTLWQIGSLLALAWTGSSVVAVAGRMLDQAWQIEHKGARWLINRLRALALAFVGLTLLTLSFGASAALRVVTLLSIFSHLNVLTQAISFVFIFVFDVIVFALAYWALPSVRLGWQDIWPGVFLAAFLWEIAKGILTWYLAQLWLFNVVYGPLTAVIAFMIWAYISGVILAFGAEFSAARKRQLTQS